MDKIITRFPPSPTGYLHVGGARTALFNWLYARKNKGTFVLRIEDTDAERSTQESVDAIFESMEWLEIDWDDGPHYQTKRYDLYKDYIGKLVDSNNAYYCTCTPEEIDAMREEAKAAGKKPKYNGKCRERGLTAGPNTVIRFKTPLTGVTVIEDVVKGNISFQNSELDDFIIQRSDGSPTYNLAVAVDDITLGINTVLRGDDHVNNTPKQMHIYQALGVTLPVYGHLPMVLGTDKARLSKRHGAMSVSEFRDMGVLPDAMLNYLVRLGWSFGDQEFFTREELIEKFTIENIGSSPGVFDPAKLFALNAEHIKASTPESLIEPLTPFLNARGGVPEDRQKLARAISTFQARSKTLIEIADGLQIYFNAIDTYDVKAAEKNFKAPAVDCLKNTVAELEKVETFSGKDLEEAFKTVMAQMELGFGKIANPVRVALSGSAVCPSVFEMIEVLGKKESVQRLKNAIEFINENR